MEVGTKLFKVSYHLDTQSFRCYKTEYTVKANKKVYVLTHTDRYGTIEKRIHKDEIFDVVTNIGTSNYSVSTYCLEQDINKVELGLNATLHQLLASKHKTLTKLSENLKKQVEYE